jgi:hypothetical protein
LFSGFVLGRLASESKASNPVIGREGKKDSPFTDDLESGIGNLYTLNLPLLA